MYLLLDDLCPRIAARLRLERDSRGWSLADLAERSGVSKATISKIEREEVSPTAVILVRLAGAFDLTLAGLLLRAEGQGDGCRGPPNSRSGATPRPAICASRCSAAPIIPWRSSRSNCRPDSGWRCRPRPTPISVRPSGCDRRLVILRPASGTCSRAGDCLGFGPPSEVTFANETAAPCSYVVALARS